MSDLQSGIEVEDGAITGTLKYVDSGALATDWGAGNFIALKFDPALADGECTYRVGLVPSVSSGFVQLDEDMDAVMKVTDKDSQKLVVITCKGYNESEQVYDLSGLTCQES